MKTLTESFKYNDGKLYWANTGKEAGWLNEKGYRRVQLNKKSYYVHKIIYFLNHGYMPDLIDHIDNNPLNNNISNLRAADKSLNRKNSKTNKNSISGVKGVHWNKNLKKFQVMFKVGEKYKSFGYYFDIDCAKFVANAMYQKYFKVEKWLNKEM